MRLTRNHLQFWEHHRRPGWAARVALPAYPESAAARWRLLMACVNEHAAPPPPRADLELANTVSLVRQWRDFRIKHGTRYDLSGEATTVHGYLERLTRDGSHPVRVKHCRRWLRRIGILRKLTARDFAKEDRS